MKKIEDFVCEKIFNWKQEKFEEIEMESRDQQQPFLSRKEDANPPEEQKTLLVTGHDERKDEENGQEQISHEFKREQENVIDSFETGKERDDEMAIVPNEESVEVMEDQIDYEFREEVRVSFLVLPSTYKFFSNCRIRTPNCAKKDKRRQ